MSVYNMNDEKYTKNSLKYEINKLIRVKKQIQLSIDTKKSEDRLLANDYVEEELNEPPQAIRIDELNSQFNDIDASIEKNNV